MRLWSLTKLGKQLVDSRTSASAASEEERDDLRVLEFVRDRGYRATDDEINFAVDGAPYISKRLQRKGLIVELTHGG